MHTRARHILGLWILVFYVPSLAQGDDTVIFAQPDIPEITSVQIPAKVEGENWLPWFRVNILQPTQSPLWMQVEVKDTLRRTQTRYSSFQPLDFNSSSADFNNTEGQFPLLAFTDVVVRARLSTTKGEKAAGNWSLPFDLYCCSNYIRPENQTTIVLSGEISEPFFTYTDKIHLANDTRLMATVGSIWEVTLSERVIFVVDFFEEKEVMIRSNFPISANQSTAILQWKEVAPRSTALLTSVTLIESPQNDQFVTVDQMNATACVAHNFTQQWMGNESNANRLVTNFDVVCNQSCSVSDETFTHNLIIAGAIESILLAGTVISSLAMARSYNYYIRINFLFGTAFGVSAGIASVVTASQAHNYFNQVNDPWCSSPNFEENRFWAIWFTPSLYFGVMSIIVMFWISLTYISSCAASDVNPNSAWKLEDSTPKSRGTQYFGLLALTFTLFWCSFTIPPLMYWLYRNEKAENDNAFLTTLLVISLPIYLILLSFSMVMMCSMSHLNFLEPCFNNARYKYGSKLVVNS